MPNRTVVNGDDGRPTHIRETTDDGRQSTLYEYDNSLWSHITGNHQGSPVEVADHNRDGSTEAFEYDNSIISQITGNHRGGRK